MILTIGEWVLRNACRRPRHGMTRAVGGCMASMSRQAIAQVEFQIRWRRYCRDTGLDPSKLELEYESVYGESWAGKALTRSRRSGIIASMISVRATQVFSRLRSGVDRLKIDRSFVASINACSRIAAIAALYRHVARLCAYRSRRSVESFPPNPVRAGAGEKKTTKQLPGCAGILAEQGAAVNDAHRICDGSQEVARAPDRSAFEAIVG